MAALRRLVAPDGRSEVIDALLLGPLPQCQ